MLLKEERLMAASLLIFANKQDVPGALTVPQISEVRTLHSSQLHLVTSAQDVCMRQISSVTSQLSKSLIRYTVLPRLAAI